MKNKYKILAHEMLKTFDDLGNDYYARIDAREWFRYYKGKLEYYDKSSSNSNTKRSNIRRNVKSVKR